MTPSFMILPSGDSLQSGTGGSTRSTLVAVSLKVCYGSLRKGRYTQNVYSRVQAQRKTIPIQSHR